ncbi:MAG TPA: hypothetical protein VGG83_16670 [Trebonia sp.]|jgi:hypothetical protein
MRNATLSTAPAQAGQADQEASPFRCPEMARTSRGWERCHRDEHAANTRHHVRDRSWSTAGNMPELRLGQPCTDACRWPDQVRAYRGAMKSRNY